MTAQEFLNRYDKKERFNEDELRALFWGDFGCETDNIEEIEEETDEKRRWSQFVYKYVRVNDRFFCFTADIGLTEYQDNSFDFQPVEVKRTIKTIVVNSWEEI